MRTPFQSLRRVLAVSVSGAGGLMAFAAAAQQPPAEPAVPTEPTRPPDCLDCPSPPAVPAMITNPTWARRPTPEYPSRAMSAGVPRGRVTIVCAVQPDGALSGCQVAEETPAGAGFGQSALAAAAAGRVSPESIDPAAAGSRVSFTINYLLPELEPIAPPPKPRR